MRLLNFFKKRPSKKLDHTIETWNAHKYYLRAIQDTQEMFAKNEISEWRYNRVCTSIMKNVYDAYREGAQQNVPKR